MFAKVDPQRNRLRLVGRPPRPDDPLHRVPPKLLAKAAHVRTQTARRWQGGHCEPQPANREFLAVLRAVIRAANSD